MRERLALVLLLTTAGACGYRASVGAIDEDAGAREDGGAPDAGTLPDGDPSRRDAGPPVSCAESPDEAPLRHLTVVEIENALADLVGVVPPTTRSLPPDELVAGFAAGTTAGILFVEGMHRVAGEVAGHVTASLTTFVPCVPDSVPRDCAEAFVRGFGARTWRRPLTDDDVTRLLALYDAAGAHAGGVGEVVEALIQSPHFLYRPERGSPIAGTTGATALTDHELATRLAALFWRSIPDTELEAAADRGELRTAAQVQAQALRMLGDPRAEGGVMQFARQWLRYEHVTDREPREGIVLPDELEEALLAETDTYVSHVLLEGDRRFDSLVASPFTFANDMLADYYDVARPGTAELVRVELDPEQRASVLTHGSILAVHATPTSRGLLVRGSFLCQAIPPPPPDTHPVDLTMDGRTRRESYEEAVRSEPACAGCHRLIDPVGFALESYDAGGRYRESDNGFPIDDTGTIVETRGGADVTVVGGPGLAAYLAGDSFVHECFVRQWMRFALHRHERPADDCMIAHLTRAFVDSGLDTRELLLALVASEGFRHRGAPAPAATIPPDAAPTSPLDHVERDLHVLRASHAGQDRILLDAHLEALRALEARLDG